jgi:AraC family transcriptional activator of pobA
MQNLQLIDKLYVAFSRKATTSVLELDKVLIDHNPFNLLRVEDLYDKTKGFIPPYRQSDYFFIFIKKGSGKRSIGHLTFNIEDNTLAIVPPHVIHSSMYSEKPNGYFILFNADFFLQQCFSYKLLKSKKVLNPSPPYFIKLNVEQAITITTILETIIKECNGGLDGQNQMVAIKVLELLLLCDRFFIDNSDSDCTLYYSEILKKFNELIETNFTKHRNVWFYAKALHTHPNNLNHIVKKITGLTAKQTIINRLIMESKYLLAATTLSVKEIAYDLGFEDQNYFSSFFKKYQAVTPSNYRNQLSV